MKVSVSAARANRGVARPPALAAPAAARHEQMPTEAPILPSKRRSVGQRQGRVWGRLSVWEGGTYRQGPAGHHCWRFTVQTGSEGVCAPGEVTECLRRPAQRRKACVCPHPANGEGVYGRARIEVRRRREEMFCPQNRPPAGTARNRPPTEEVCRRLACSTQHGYHRNEHDKVGAMEYAFESYTQQTPPGHPPGHVPRSQRRNPGHR